MKKITPVIMKLLFTMLIALFAATGGCSLDAPSGGEGKVQVVVTLSFFEDMVSRVGGDMVRVTALVPVGVEPEEYEPLPGDLRAINDAGVFIYNGYNLERWLPRLASGILKSPDSKSLAENPAIETIPLPAGAYAGMVDPHVWTDVMNAVVYVEKIAEILAGYDPGNASYYRERAAVYIEELVELDSWIKEQVERIPPGDRILVSSELCFQYFSAAYGFQHDAIWAINSAEEGTPAQIIRIVELVKDKEVPVVFVENQVDQRPMEQVSRETGVPIGGVLYSDSLSKPGEGAETYIKMMEANTRLIVKALSGREN